MSVASRKFRRRDDVELREVGEDAFLIDSATGRIHHLNATGAALWRLLAEPTTLREMLDVFREAFPDRTRRVMKKKLKDVLEDFEDSDLLGDEDGRAIPNVDANPAQWDLARNPAE
jgi:hypothetical protein